MRVGHARITVNIVASIAAHYSVEARASGRARGRASLLNTQRLTNLQGRAVHSRIHSVECRLIDRELRPDEITIVARGYIISLRADCGNCTTAATTAASRVAVAVTQGYFDRVDERVATLAAEFATKIVQVKGPDHGTAKTFRIHIIDLFGKKKWRKRSRLKIVKISKKIV